MAKCKTLTKAAGKYNWEAGVEVTVADKNDLKDLIDGGYVILVDEPKPAAKTEAKSSGASSK